jgi:ribonuclease D
MNFRRKKRAMHHAEAHADEAPAASKVMVNPFVPQGDPELIDSRAGLDIFMAHVREEGSFAYDTEFIGEETFIPNICLLQLATRTRIALIDPFAFDAEALETVWNAVCDPALTTIVHAGGQDIEAAQRRTNRQALNVIDTQIAAGFLGMPWPTSLVNVVQAVANLR